VLAVPIRAQRDPARIIVAACHLPPGRDRVGAGRLQRLSYILQVPVTFFFEDLPLPSEASSEEGAYLDEFLATSDGLSLTKHFMRIKDPKLRRRIVDLVEQIAAGYD
jgi:hypothetical protein